MWNMAFGKHSSFIHWSMSILFLERLSIIALNKISKRGCMVVNPEQKKKIVF